MEMRNVHAFQQYLNLKQFSLRLNDKNNRQLNTVIHVYVTFVLNCSNYKTVVFFCFSIAPANVISLFFLSKCKTNIFLKSDV